MPRRLFWIAGPALAMVVLASVGQARDEKGKGTSVLDFKMKDIDGKEVDLSQYKGDVLLLVNVASKCGYTPQYEGLEEVYRKYKDRGFKVLAFPANEFGKQEPGSDAE